MTEWFEFECERIYEASDGEFCRMSVKIRLPEDNRERAQAAAEEYFDTYGNGVVESAKAARQWPLPPDHPNSPRVPSGA